MFVGVPGSGKTTLARQLAQVFGGVTINSDAMRLSMWGSRAAIQAAHTTKEQRVVANQLTFGAMDYAAGQIIAAGHSVVYDCNANERAERTKMAGIARANGGMSVVVHLRTSREIAIQRILERQETHDQPRPVGETAETVVDRFAREIEEPDSDERTIEISGEIPFEEQLALFEQQLAQIG